MSEVARRVLARYRKAFSGDPNLWTNASQALERYNQLYASAMALRDPLDARGVAVLEKFSLDNPEAWPVDNRNAFGKWMVKCYEGKHNFYSLVGPYGVLRGTQPLADYQQYLVRVHDAVEEVVSSIGHERFTYRGFTIWNLQRMTDSICRPMLEAIDYLLALFKKRGVSVGLLREGLKVVTLEPDLDELGRGTAGIYVEGAISLSAKTLRGNSASMLERWINHTFLHEFGHHVHLHVLPSEAVRAWEEPWVTAEQAIETATRKVKAITRQERERFFALLERSDFDVKQAAANLKGFDKLKFGVWLRDPRKLITPSRFQLTSEGKQVFGFFKDFYQDPDRYTINDYAEITLSAPELEAKKALLLEMNKRPLGLDQRSTGDQEISEKQTELLIVSDRDVHLEVIRAESRLYELKQSLVSDYARSSSPEDFAETFVAFMGAPQRLTDASRFRMQRTLSVSGLYGKPIVRLAYRDRVDRHRV